MKTAQDFRIENVQKAILNGRQVKLFKAFEDRGDAFHYIGQFSAPVKTANKELWKVAADAE